MNTFACMKKKKTLFLTCLLMAGIMLAGFWLRFDSLPYWLNNPQIFFFHDRNIPITLNVDSYYYYDIAADLKKGIVRKVDQRRHYPKGTQKPVAVPLLSVLLAFFSSVFGTSIEWVGVVLPTFLGPLLALPVFFLGRGFIEQSEFPAGLSPEQRKKQALLFGLASSFFALLSPYFIKRSSLGWCDTDILNVFFATSCIVMAMGIADADTQKKKFLYGAGWCCSAFLFAWWWDMGLTAVAFFSGLPLGVAIVFSSRKSGKNLLPFLIIGVLVFSLLVLLNGWQVINPYAFVSRGLSLLDYIGGKQEAGSVFPVLEQYVGEQRNLSLAEISDNVGGGLSVLLLSIVGLLVLCLLIRRNIVYLASLIIVGCLSFKGMRFLIFTAPLFGFGIATLLLVLWNIPKKRLFGGIASLLLVIFVAADTIIAAQKFNHRKPTLSPALFDAYKEISAVTPEKSVIWASWSNGHPLIYYSQRRTIGDGIYHPRELLYYQDFPLATDNYRLAANWIRFFVVNGEKGLARANELFADSRSDWAKGMPVLQRLLRVGVAESRAILRQEFRYDPGQIENILSFLFPVQSPPIYLFLDFKHFLFEAWYGLGAWDLQHGRGPQVLQILMKDFGIGDQGRRIFAYSNEYGNVSFDIRNGSGTVGSIRTALRSVTMHNGITHSVFDYPEHKTGNYLYLIRANGMELGALLSPNLANSIFAELLLEKNGGQKFIVPVLDKGPVYVLCRVNGDEYSAPD